MKKRKRYKNRYSEFICDVSIALMVTLLAAMAVSIISLTNKPVTTETVSMDSSHSWYYKPRTDGEMPIVADDAPFISEYDNVIYKMNDGIAITFDTGYENGNTEKILDVLKEKDVKAAFFVTGHYVKTNPELIKRMEAEGHLVCNHTVNHADLSQIGLPDMKKELEGLSEMYKEVTGNDMVKFVRPPEGKYSERFIKNAKSEGYKIVFWSFAYKDWIDDDQPTEEEAIKTVLSRSHNGMVALLHSNSSTNAKILGRLIDEWKKNYTIKRIDEA